MRPVDYAALGGLALIWGASYALIKIGLTELSPAVLVAARVGLGFLTLVVAVAARRLELGALRRLAGHLVVLGVIGIAVPYGLISWGETRITSDLAAMLQATTPLFTVLLAPLWGAQERLTARTLGGVLVGLAGVVVLIGLPVGGQGAGGAGALLGTLALVGASLAYAGTALYARRTVRGEPAVVVALGQMAVASLVMAPLAAVIGPLPAHLPAPNVLAAVAFLAIGGTGIAYILYYWLIANVGATRTTTVTYLLPLTALLWGALFLGETVTPRMAAGLVCILGGVVLVTGSAGRPAASAAHMPASRRG